MSEYTARYQQVSHQQLFDAVRAGDPEQIDGLASSWSSMKGTLDDLARDLRGDLEKLANGWTGDAGQEFQRRLSLIVDYSTTLSEGMADVRQGLTLMAADLRTARKEAESPAETDDHDKAVSGAIKGGLTGGLPGAIVGGFMGHEQDKAEQEKAHRRMVKVVAELAAGYDLSAYGRLVDPPPPDRDLPHDPNTSTSTPSAGPGAHAPRSAPGGGFGTPTTGQAWLDAPGNLTDGPNTGTTGGNDDGSTSPGGTGGAGGTGLDTGTSLAGAAPLGNGLPAGPVGTTGVVTAAASAGSGAGLLFGAPAGAPVGVLGGGTGSLAGSARAGATVAARPAGGLAGAEHRAATGVGRVGGNGTGGGRAGVLGGRGRADDDESDERLTWLTEDEMVWRDGDPGVPPVLGAG
ncbi:MULTISPECIES: WXG100 family type VII secretion target [unclassified Micromonospora]|uniref:WXG100 family type VII secretion target n=1 Tax=unclassified Micromonospora TaxID=2617518 RepID=UPI00363874D3